MEKTQITQCRQFGRILDKMYKDMAQVAELSADMSMAQGCIDEGRDWVTKAIKEQV